MTEHPHDHERSQCHALLASLSEYVDGDLDPAICDEIEKHMAECEGCEIVVDTLRKTIELVHATASAPPVPEDVRARLFMRLKLDDFLLRHKSVENDPM